MTRTGEFPSAFAEMLYSVLNLVSMYCGYKLTILSYSKDIDYHKIINYISYKAN